jgi:hypothetical protein
MCRQKWMFRIVYALGDEHGVVIVFKTYKEVFAWGGETIGQMIRDLEKNPGVKNVLACSGVADVKFAPYVLMPSGKVFMVYPGYLVAEPCSYLSDMCTIYMLKPEMEDEVVASVVEEVERQTKIVRYV